MAEPEERQNLDQALGIIGFLIIILGFFVYLSSINWTGSFVPNVPEWADFICYSSLFVGMSLMIWSLILEHRTSKAIELRSLAGNDSTKGHLKNKNAKFWKYIFVIFAIDLAIMIFAL